MSEIKKHRAFRLEDSLWKNFQHLADAKEVTTTSVLTKFIKECIRKNSIDWFIDTTKNNNVNTFKENVDTSVDTSINTFKRYVNTSSDASVDTSVDTSVNTNQSPITYEEFEAKILAALDQQLEKKTSDPIFVSRIVNEVIGKKSTSASDNATTNISESVSNSADILPKDQLNLLELLQNEQSENVINVPPIEESIINHIPETIIDNSVIATVNHVITDPIIPEIEIPQSTKDDESAIASIENATTDLVVPEIKKNQSTENNVSAIIATAKAMDKKDPNYLTKNNIAKKSAPLNMINDWRKSKEQNRERIIHDEIREILWSHGYGFNRDQIASIISAAKDAI